MDKNLHAIVGIFLVNKAFIVAVSALAIAILPLGAGYKINSSGPANPLAQWDGEAYLTIAERGYAMLPDGRSLYNFLPLYPLTIRLFGYVTGDTAIAAVILSSAFSFIASYFLLLLAELEFGRAVAKKTVLLLLFFPTAFFFSAVYTESMFLAFAIASFYYARKGDWARASVLSWFLPFIRIVGLFFWVVLLAEYFVSDKKTRRDALLLASSLLAVALFFVYSAYSTGSIFGYLNQQNLWSRSVSSPHIALLNALSLLFRGPVLAIYTLWNLSVLVLFAATLYYAVKYMRRTYALYMLFVMMLPLLSSTLEGFSRFILLCFPTFMILARFLGENKKFYMPTLSFFIFFAAVLTARFVTGAVGTLVG
jgi:hypothetical protein